MVRVGLQRHRKKKKKEKERKNMSNIIYDLFMKTGVTYVSISSNIETG